MKVHPANGLGKRGNKREEEKILHPPQHNFLSAGKHSTNMRSVDSLELWYTCRHMMATIKYMRTKIKESLVAPKLDIETNSLPVKRQLSEVQQAALTYEL